jgi:hypothetical protein
MISLQCTHCQQRLEMDDAFAGGVCRCQYCGTIQTVPKKGRSGSGTSSKSSSKSASAKALYKKNGAGAAGQQNEPPQQAGTGLDELAQIVASSGLARGSLRKPPPVAAGRDRAEGAGPTDESADAAVGGPRPKPASPVRPVFIAGGAVIGVLLVLVFYFAFRGPAAPPTPAGQAGRTPPQATTPAPDEHTTPAEVTGPSFAGIPLGDHGDVVYVLDRSQANEPFMDALKVAAYKSIRSLGGKRNFQVIFWHRTDEGIVAYPEDRTAPASGDEIAAARKRFEDVVAYQTTDLKPTVSKAVSVTPAAIVIVTAKGPSLEESSVATVREAIGDVSGIKVHTLSLGEAESPVLKQIAEQFGGEYRQVTLSQLRELAR